jgi:hypothetical protein
VFAFSEDITIPSGGQKSKETAQNIFGQKVFKREEFQEAGLLGSHSIRKFASTHVRGCGISKDDRDTRGRWKGRSRASDRYDDVELPYPDCKVAEKLCIGGPCYYVFNNDICSSNVLTTFILTRVVPNIRRRLPDSTVIVLGKAVLWLVYSSDADNCLSAEYCESIRGSLSETGINVVDGQNPIRKIPVLVSGDQGTVYIDELAGAQVVGGGGVAEGGAEAQHEGGDEVLNHRLLENNRTAGGDQLRNMLLQLQSGILGLRRENIELRSDMAGMMQAMTRGFEIVNGNLRRVSMQTAVQRRVRPETGIDILATAAATGTGGALMAPALAMTNPPTLMPNPKSLFDLWNEYLDGVGGGERPQGCSLPLSEGG